MILQYHMIREHVFPPVRSNPSDAGLDLRWSPSDHTVRGMRIEPGESAVIPTGCKFAIPHGFMMEIKNWQVNDYNSRFALSAYQDLYCGGYGKCQELYS